MISQTLEDPWKNIEIVAELRRWSENVVISVDN